MRCRRCLSRTSRRSRSGSPAATVKFALLGSTANHPESDIHHFYKQGDQQRFHTRCPECDAAEPLDEYFPACIGFDAEFTDPETGAPGAYRYRCRAGHWISDAQIGEWRSTNPEAHPKTTSIHFPQMLSPTVTPGELYLAYLNSQDMKNFYNRKLGKPYQDPQRDFPSAKPTWQRASRKAPAWASSGRRPPPTPTWASTRWGRSNRVIITERLPDGRDAVIHVEEIYGESPRSLHRIDEGLRRAGLRRGAAPQRQRCSPLRGPGGASTPGLLLCTGYGDIDDGVAHWGDGPKLTTSQRRTDEEARDRWIVRIDQYKAMSSTLRRIAATGCLFPDPGARVQQVREKDATFEVRILKERVFPHLLRTALVTKRKNELERKYRRVVEKRGNDPHHAFAFMLCDVAMTRAHGTATFLIPDMSNPERPTSSEHHPGVQEILYRQPAKGACGGCKPTSRAARCTLTVPGKGHLQVPARSARPPPMTEDHRARLRGLRLRALTSSGRMSGDMKGHARRLELSIDAA